VQRRGGARVDKGKEGRERKGESKEKEGKRGEKRGEKKGAGREYSPYQS